MKRRKKPMTLVERIAKDRTAPAGMFRALVCDAWEPPPNHTIVGDYGTPLVARRAALDYMGDDPWLEAHVYDDLGRNVWSSRPAPARGPAA